jgi:hypothetical protein
VAKNISMVGSKSDVDAFLKDLFTTELYRSMPAVRSYAVRITDKRLKRYFEKRGLEMLAEFPPMRLDPNW